MYVQTDDENKVGTQKIMIRDCDQLNRLLELNLYIQVLTNTYPDFVDTVKTSWEMPLNVTRYYRLPAWNDPDNNDQAEIYVSEMEGQESKYPPFLAFVNSTNTLSFRPVDKWTQGHTYFF